MFHLINLTKLGSSNLVTFVISENSVISVIKRNGVSGRYKSTPLKEVSPSKPLFVLIGTEL